MLVQATLDYAAPRLTKGCDFTWVFQVVPPLNALFSEGDIATLLETATVTAFIVDTDDESTEILALTAVVDSAANRKIGLSASAEQTADLVPGIYRWKVRVTLTTPTAATVAVGALGPAQVYAL